MVYKIDINRVKKDYSMQDPTKKPTHKPKTKDKLIVPYNVRPLKEHKDIIKRFDECIGSFCCNLLNCNTTDFNKDSFFSDIINTVEFETEYEREKFKEIVSTVFFDKDNNISKFHPKVLVYSTTEEENIEMGNFLYDVLFDEKARYGKFIEDVFEDKTGNVLSDLILDKLPELDINSERREKQYKNFAEEITSVFNEDLRYILERNRDFCSQIVTLLKFYYVVYILRSVGNLNNMFHEKEVPPIYFTFDWEKVSKGRIGYENGWCLVESAITSLRSHEICLNILNCSEDGRKKYNYKEFKELVSKMNDDEKLETWENLSEVVGMYETAIKDENEYWKEYEFSSDTDDDILVEVEKLYGLIHNHHSKVTNAIELSRRYYDWFFEFCRNNFLRNRGRNGMTLNLTEEYVILLTKLCIKDEQKVRLQYIIKELERRGVYLDKDSRNRLIDFYQRLNVLEKKSDSGDALYVRTIL
ncbi:MAG: DNA phosphorothioation-dependent restriction protein DptG [Clostridium sp.]|uniref:DNA phosphorothioation-dependent restriction protein DptG n=1 Tax=Clostridium sp. TaxID=1506 RepID=UPI0025C5F644|nr:DNA phosphorothioation-dependent restriction protein DptG [Clostridium sp.]MCF0149309.1 DNA phosphorothioation-dependent restriction protein DptG [Clostridium sp.]